MSTALVEAIDRAVAMTKGGSMNPFEVVKFKKLAKEVSILAHQAGLQEALPQREELLNYHEQSHPPITLVGILNLPGEWFSPTPDKLLSQVFEIDPLGKQWPDAMKLLRQCAVKTLPQPVPEQTTETIKKKMSLEEVAARLIQIHKQGLLFTNYKEQAQDIGCSSSTVHKAVRETPALHEWANYQSDRQAPLRAQSLNDVVTDSKTQTTELLPDELAEIHLYREKISKRISKLPGERDKEELKKLLAAFDSASIEVQLLMAENPDDYDRILGRKL